MRKILMSAIRLSLLSASLSAFCPAWADDPRSREETRTAGEVIKEDRCERVGQIFIIGNTLTRDSDILRQIPFKEGDKLQRADFQTAVRNLTQLQLFKTAPAPCVRILDNNREEEDVFKDILLEVSERDCNVYLYAVQESLEFADLWARWGFFAAIVQADENLFPIELFLYALPGGKEFRPLALRYLLHDLGLAE